MQVRTLLARLFVVTLLAVQIFKPGVAWAQEPPATGDTAQVGGQSITPEDIAAAIKSPTPNLANTTAYVFYTITVLLTGTFDPSIMAAGTMASAPQSSLRAEYPSNVNDAISKRGLIGGVGYLMTGLVKNPPASAGTYVADVVSNSRFAPQTAYAQAPGLGFGALNPILGTWKAFRNVAYYLLVLIGFVVGILVLIRHKVSGNVAVTVQNALPRIVITIVLITFSYAIAGLMVDLMFLSIYFVINIFDGQIFETGARFGSVLGSEGRSLTDLAFNTHLFQFTIEYIFSGSAWGSASAIGDIIWTALSGVPILDLLTEMPVVSDLVHWIIQQIFALIFAIAIFIAMFRTFFSLIMSYAGFVINVVMAPFILLPGALPGSNPFAGWIKNLIASLAPFVVVIFMIFMAFALTGENTVGDIGYKDVANNQTGLRLPLILSGADTSAFIGILAMGFILMMPEAVNITRKAVGASGGMFDEFKDKAVATFQKGWEGNKYVPGAKKVAPALATGAVVGGAGAIAGGAYGGAQAGNMLANNRGWTGNQRKAAQIVGGIGGGLVGAALSPAATTVGAAGATGYTIGKTGVYDPMKNKVTEFLKGDSPASKAAATMVTESAGYLQDRQHRNQPVQPVVRTPANPAQEPRTPGTNERFNPSTPPTPPATGR